jgi:CspA family cold shock protein
VPVGAVKWFNVAKGYGFIKPADGSRDLVVTMAAVQAAGLADLVEGQRVIYDLGVDRGKAAASAIRLA